MLFLSSLDDLLSYADIIIFFQEEVQDIFEIDHKTC